MKFTKEQFCTAVDKYEQMCQEEDQILEKLGASPEWKPSEWLGAYYSLISTLCEFKEDNEFYGTDLDYYCYDLDFGKKWKPGMITDKNGKDIPLRNSNDLWHLLMEV